MPARVASSDPRKLTACVYNVGFGECTLLTFHYPSRERHILVGFGSMDASNEAMLSVAQDIRKRCAGKLHAIVAANPRRTHTSGFALSDPKGAEPVIRACKPDLVIQPWLEEPRPRRASGKQGRAGPIRSDLLASIESMGEVAEALLAANRTRAGTPHRARELEFLLEKNLPFRAALKSLNALGEQHEYVSSDSPSRLGKIIPGVRVQVLGPPHDRYVLTATRRQFAMEMAGYRRRWENIASAAEFCRRGRELFPRTAKLPESSVSLASPVRNLHETYLKMMIDIAEEIDRAIGNLSVVLFLQTGSTGVLLPGDALIESWSSALRDAKVRAALARTKVYKVGAQGSDEGTPKSLWNLFAARSTKPGSGRLVTLLSSKPGQQGSALEGNEVPHSRLVEALKSESNLYYTRLIPQGRFFDVTEVDLKT